MKRPPRRYCQNGPQRSATSASGEDSPALIDTRPGLSYQPQDDGDALCDTPVTTGVIPILGKSLGRTGRWLSALESLPYRGGLRETTPYDAGDNIRAHQDERLSQSYDPSRHPMSGNSTTPQAIRYLHRPLDGFGQLLSLDHGFQAYLAQRYKRLSDPHPDVGVQTYITHQMCQVLEPVLVPLLAFSPYIPSLSEVYALAKADPSLPRDFLLAVLCSLALRRLPEKSEESKYMDGLVDCLGTTVLLSVPPAVETVIALSLLLTYEPTALCRGPLRFGPLKGPAIIGENLMTAVVPMALSLGFQQAEIRTHQSSSSPRREAPNTVAGTVLCDEVAKVSVWWALSAWQAHFAFNQTPFQPTTLSKEVQAASRYTATTVDLNQSGPEALREQGRRWLAHRVIMLAEVHTAIQILEGICIRLQRSAITEVHLLTTTTPPSIQQIRLEAEDLCRQTQFRLAELEELRDADSLCYEPSPLSHFMEGWLCFEQNALHSLLLSKVACAGVTGTTEFVLPVPAFIEAISSNEITSSWLERPGRARRDAAERVLGVFCGLERGEVVKMPTDSERGCANSQATKTARATSHSILFDYLSTVPPVLTNALLLDSCRMLLEAEAFTLMVHRTHLSRRECLVALMRQSAVRLRQCQTDWSGSRQRLDISGACGQEMNLCMAGMLDDMLATLSKWHLHRRRQQARSVPRCSSTIPSQVPRPEDFGMSASGPDLSALASGEALKATLPETMASTPAPPSTEPFADDQAVSTTQGVGSWPSDAATWLDQLLWPVAPPWQ